MQREGHGAFGASTAAVTVNVTAPPPPVNNAQVVGVSAPARMTTGQRYDVAVTMQNTGTSTWTPDANFRLGSQNPHNNNTWGLGRVLLGTAVAPGQQYTFRFTVTAPETGDYDMQWGMVEEWVQWFGATASHRVAVSEDLGNVTFIHTDGLGSPVARFDGAGNLISRTRYEPYGYTASGAAPTIGFTGHVNDVATGLTYMQQRYYDPVAGRFLSIDPVVTDANTGRSFNRYAYANNSPYNYIDPDGRQVSRLLALRSPIGIPGQVPSGSNNQLPSFPVLHPVGTLITMSQVIQAVLTTGNTQPQSPVINPADVAGKTPAEIGQVATDAGLVPKGPDPLGGKGSFNDPVTGEQRVLVHGDHAHVNDSEGNRVDINGNKVDPKSPEAHLPIKPPPPPQP